jgi:carbon-monoxide dehydrogenase small subunit
MSEHRCDIRLTVNGETVIETVDVRKTLVDFLRDDLVLTGSHVGCEHGVCGACTVRVDGVVVRGCLMLAAQCDGASVETIEGVSDLGEIADLQKAFEQRNALQCGFCTPGMLLTAQELLANGKVPSRDKIREQISGNYCRCTGYHAIVDAIEAVAQARAGKKIAPTRIHSLDHFEFPSPIPLFDLALPQKSRFSGLVDLIPNQQLHSVRLRKAGNGSGPMLPCAPNQIVGRADIQSAVSLARQNVHKETQWWPLGPRFRGDERW